jgi:hypothetical protein
MMTRFQLRCNELLEHTDLDPNELTIGDVIRNVNPECKHFKSKGKVIAIKPMHGDTGESGNLVRYIVLNRGKTFNPGDELEKTEIQLDKIL